MMKVWTRWTALEVSFLLSKDCCLSGCSEYLVNENQEFDKMCQYTVEIILGKNLTLFLTNCFILDPHSYYIDYAAVIGYLEC